MIERLSWSVTNFFVQRKVVLKEDDEIYAYGFECLIADALQYIILIISGILIGNLIPLALVSAGFVSIKKHIGGYHANSHFECILGTSLGLICGSLVFALLPSWASLFLLFVSGIIIYMLAPIQHVNNPRTEEELKTSRKLSFRNATVISIASLILLACPLNNLAIFLSGGLFLAAFTLPMPYKVS